MIYFSYKHILLNSKDTQSLQRQGSLSANLASHYFSLEALIAASLLCIFPGATCKYKCK